MTPQAKPQVKSQVKPAAALRHPVAVMVYLLLLIWVAAPLVPEDTGLRLGLGFRIFYSFFVLLGGAVVLLVRMGAIKPPSSQGAALGTIAVVFVLTLAIPTVIGTVYPYPQLKVPKPGETGDAGLSPAEVGKKLFFGEGDLQPSCSLCHRWEGKGGNRGPELTDVKSVAGSRKEGVSAEEYVRDHILKGSPYFTVPGFPAMMPPFEGNINDEQLEALMALMLGEGGE